MQFLTTPGADVIYEIPTASRTGRLSPQASSGSRPGVRLDHGRQRRLASRAERADARDRRDRDRPPPAGATLTGVRDRQPHRTDIETKPSLRAGAGWFARGRGRAPAERRDERLRGSCATRSSFAALATVADVAAVGEPRARPRGCRAEGHPARGRARVARKPRPGRTLLSTDDVVWRLAPSSTPRRLSRPDLAIDLLTTDDPAKAGARRRARGRERVTARIGRGRRPGGRAGEGDCSAARETRGRGRRLAPRRDRDRPRRGSSTRMTAHRRHQARRRRRRGSAARPAGSISTRRSRGAARTSRTAGTRRPRARDRPRVAPAFVDAFEAAVREQTGGAPQPTRTPTSTARRRRHFDLACAEAIRRPPFGAGNPERFSSCAKRRRRRPAPARRGSEHLSFAQDARLPSVIAFRRAKAFGSPPRVPLT